MKQLKREVASSFNRFDTNWRSELSEVTAELDKEEQVFLDSYTRLTTLQAWRVRLLDARISKESCAFFLEAQNDAVLSHVLAHSGAFNPALKSLRSTIENVLNCLYYMDHPVEYELWSKGAQRLSFKDLSSYFTVHPKLSGIKLSEQVLAHLNIEYGTLSRAVHASAKSFRMTEGADKPLLLSSAKSRLGPWVTREKATILNVNILLLLIFREELQNARNLDLRKSISFAIPDGQHRIIKELTGVTLFKS